MGVFGLLSHCLESGCGTEVDLFQVAKDRKGIELVIDFTGFAYEVLYQVSQSIRDQDSQWLAVDYLGGEYHILNQMVKTFCKVLTSHQIAPVFFDDGARGSDPMQRDKKMETWILRNDQSIATCKELSSYLQGLSAIDDIHGQIMPFLTQDQTKATLKRCISEYGGMFITCKGEADDVMAKYLHDTPQAYAILGNDSDFCVMKNCRFIIMQSVHCGFDWKTLLYSSDDLDDEQCNVTVYTTDDIQQSLGLNSHRELVDVAILAGNDFTKPLLTKLWKERTYFLDVVKWYQDNIAGDKQLEESQQLESILAAAPDLKEAIEYSRRFYNLSDVGRKCEDLGDEGCQLKRYLDVNVETFKLPSATLAWYKGMSWGACVLEDYRLPSIDDWCTQLCIFLISMCTEKKSVAVMSRTNLRALDTRALVVKTFDWLPKAHQFPYVDDESRWKLFDRIVGHMEFPIKHATKEDIYKGIELHSFFQGYGTRAGFLIHAINYMMTTLFEHKFQMETWEYVSLLATALYCVDKEGDKVKFKQTWIKPTMRCITLGNWYQYIFKVVYRLSRILLISENFPEPQHAYQGTYFTSLYMTVKEKGISQNYVDPNVLETLNHIVEENRVLDGATKDKMKKELGFIEYEDPNADSNLSEEEDEMTDNIPHHLELDKLPIEAYKDEILERINKYRVVCIQGRTGSGKSTKVPQFIVQEYEDQRQRGGDVSNPHIIVTQPRRIAAKSLAGRVAQEMGDTIGNRVGYKIGCDHTFSDKTQIMYVTTGYMIELLVHNPSRFNRFSHVILDEIHERDLDADLMSLIVRLLMDTHTKPKIIVMSATLQADLFVMYFTQSKSTAAVVSQQVDCDVKSPYKVQELYIEDLVKHYGQVLPEEAQIGILKLFCQFQGKSISEIVNSSVLKGDKSYSNLALKKVKELASKLISGNGLTERDMTGKPKGHVVLNKNNQLKAQLIQALAKPGESILLFLPGKKDIDDMYDLLAPYEECPGEETKLSAGWRCTITLFILHSSIPFEDQQLCMSTPKHNTCHVILSTNLAESSLTIPRVTVIIDSGLRRHLVYDVKRRVRCLQTGWCSRASMMQRRGRTGRVCDGICIRMMTQQHYEDQPPFDEPQMKVAPLDKLLLQVKYVGKHIRPDQKPSELLLQAVEPPAITNIDAAARTLSDIGALTAPDECADVTLLGQLIMKLPLDLNNCRVVFYGCLFGCPCDAVVMAAALQSQDPFTLPSKKVLKDQELFIEKILQSFHSRKAFDSNGYSEPVMFRNMYRSWLKKTMEIDSHDDSTEFRSYSRAGNQLPSREQLRKKREKFCEHNSVMEKRLIALENLVADVANNTLHCLPRLSENFHKLQELVNIIPNRGRRQGRKTEHVGMESGIQGFYTIKQLFSEDLLLLNIVLAASLSPKFVTGAVKANDNEGNKSAKSLNKRDLESLMKKSNVDPQKSISLQKPKQLLKKDELLNDIVQSISLIGKDPGKKKQHSKKEKKEKRALKNRKRDFKIGKSEDNSRLLVEYSITDVSQGVQKPNEKVDPKYQVTSDVHHYLHYPYQFSEAPSGAEFYMELPNDAAKAYCQSRFIKMPMPESPFRINWCIMSSEGQTLKHRNKECKAICGWRNPIGFSCDLSKRHHYGVTAKFTNSMRGGIGWADGIALFPVYQENLYAILIMLAFTPEQHGVGFKIFTREMVITEIVLFEHTIPVSKKYSLTVEVLKFINEIRTEVSSILVNIEASIHTQIPDSKLGQIYKRILTYLESNVTENENKSTERQNHDVVSQNEETSKHNFKAKDGRAFTSNKFEMLEDLEETESSNISPTTQPDINSDSTHIIASEEDERKSKEVLNLPQFVTVNAFKASVRSGQKEAEKHWRSQTPSRLSQNSAHASWQTFHYLAPYDVNVLDRDYLAEFHIKHNELLQVDAKIEDSDAESEDDDIDDVLIPDPEYISIYTYSKLNPERLKDNLKAKVIAHLGEEKMPKLVSDLIKDESIAENINEITKRSGNESFNLGDFLKNNSSEFLVAALSMKKSVVCWRSSEMGKVFCSLINGRNQVEEYVLTLVFCVLLEVSNQPQNIARFKPELQNCVRKLEKKKKVKEAQQLSSLLHSDLVPLMSKDDQVFNLESGKGGGFVISLRAAIYRKISGKPAKTNASRKKRKGDMKRVIKEELEISDNDKMLSKSQGKPKVEYVTLSALQKTCIKENLYDHLIQNNNVPVNFNNVLQIPQISDILRETTTISTSPMMVNWKKVLTHKKGNQEWFEIDGCFVRLFETVFSKILTTVADEDCTIIDNELDSIHKDLPNEVPDYWENLSSMNSPDKPDVDEGYQNQILVYERRGVLASKASGVLEIVHTSENESDDDSVKSYTTASSSLNGNLPTFLTSVVSTDSSCSVIPICENLRSNESCLTITEIDNSFICKFPTVMSTAKELRNENDGFITCMDVTESSSEAEDERVQYDEIEKGKKEKDVMSEQLDEGNIIYAAEIETDEASSIDIYEMNDVETDVMSDVKNDESNYIYGLENDLANVVRDFLDSQPEETCLCSLLPSSPEVKCALDKLKQAKQEKVLLTETLKLFEMFEVYRNEKGALTVCLKEEVLTSERSTAKIELRNEILKLFETSYASRLSLSDIQTVQIMEKWRKVKNEGEDMKFTEYIKDDDEYFLTEIEDTEWHIECKKCTWHIQSKWDAKERDQFSEEEYRNNSQSRQSLDQCNITSGSHTTAAVEKRENHGKEKFMSQNNFSVSIPNLATNQCLEDTQFMNTEVGATFNSILFKDALLSQSVPIEKTTSMILLPTSKKQKTAEEELHTKAIQNESKIEKYEVEADMRSDESNYIYGLEDDLANVVRDYLSSQPEETCRCDKLCSFPKVKCALDKLKQATGGNIGLFTETLKLFEMFEVYTNDQGAFTVCLKEKVLTPEKSTAEIELYEEILKLFEASKAFSLSLPAIETTQIMNKWKKVKHEGKYMKFTDYLKDDNEYFLAEMGGTGWIIECKKCTWPIHIKCDAKNRNDFTEEKNGNTSQDIKTLYQCNVASGSQTTIAVEKQDHKSNLHHGKENLLISQNTISVSIPNLSTNRCLQDTQFMNTEEGETFCSNTFRDALVAQPAPIKKTTSMILLPTGKKQETKEEELLTKAIQNETKIKQNEQKERVGLSDASHYIGHLEDDLAYLVRVYLSSQPEQTCTGGKLSSGSCPNIRFVLDKLKQAKGNPKGWLLNTLKLFEMFEVNTDDNGAWSVCLKRFTSERSTAEIELRNEILKLFETSKAFRLFLSTIQTPQIMDKWKKVKNEGIYMKFTEYLKEYDEYFLTETTDTELIIECKKCTWPMHFKCDARERNPFAEEEYESNSKGRQSLYQCDVTSGSHMTIAAEKLDNHGMDNFLMPQNTFSVSIPNLSTKQGSEDTQLMNTEVGTKFRPISFRDALLAQPAPIKKTTSMIHLPTGNKQKTAEEELLTKAIQNVFKERKVTSLLLKDIQNPATVQKLWSTVLHKHSIRFTDYLKNDFEHFVVEQHPIRGWLVHLKVGTRSSVSVNVPSLAKEDAKISKPQVYMSSKEHIETNFISAVEEYLSELPENKCPIVQLPVLNDNVKAAWKYFKNNATPEPKLKAVLMKHSNIFTIVNNQANREAVRLVNRKVKSVTTLNRNKQLTDQMVAETHMFSQEEIQQIEVGVKEEHILATSTESAKSFQYQLPKPMKSDVFDDAEPTASQFPVNKDVFEKKIQVGQEVCSSPYNTSDDIENYFQAGEGTLQFLQARENTDSIKMAENLSRREDKMDHYVTSTGTDYTEHGTANTSLPYTSKDEFQSEEFTCPYGVLAEEVQNNAELDLCEEILQVLKGKKTSMLPLKEIQTAEVIDRWKEVKEQGQFSKFTEFLQDNKLGKVNAFYDHKNETPGWIVRKWKLKRTHSRLEDRNVPTDTVVAEVGTREKLFTDELGSASSAPNIYMASNLQSDHPVSDSATGNALYPDTFTDSCIPCGVLAEDVHNDVLAEGVHNNSELDSCREMQLNDIKTAEVIDRCKDVNEPTDFVKDNKKDTVKAFYDHESETPEWVIRKFKQERTCSRLDDTNAPNNTVVAKGGNRRQLFTNEVLSASSTPNIHMASYLQSDHAGSNSATGNVLYPSTSTDSCIHDGNVGTSTITLEPFQLTAPLTSGHTSLHKQMAYTMLKKHNDASKSMQIQSEDVITLEYIETNFISAVKEYLGNLLVRSCLVSLLTITSQNVKTAWECYKCNFKTEPDMNAVLMKYPDTFELRHDKLGRQVVILSATFPPSEMVKDEASIESNNSQGQQQIEYDTCSTLSDLSNKDGTLQLMAESYLTGMNVMEMAALKEGPNSKSGLTLHYEAVKSTLPDFRETCSSDKTFSRKSSTDIVSTMESFCRSHKMQLIQTVTNRHGEHFLCNAVLSDKTIGQGYGESEDIARAFALSDALQWLQKIFKT